MKVEGVAVFLVNPRESGLRTMKLGKGEPPNEAYSQSTTGRRRARRSQRAAGSPRVVPGAVCTDASTDRERQTDHRVGDEQGRTCAWWSHSNCFSLRPLFSSPRSLRLELALANAESEHPVRATLRGSDS